MNELWQNLIEGVDMITENDVYWPRGVHGTPKRKGVLPEIDRFDSLFFEINPKQNKVYDFEHKILLEVVHEAIIDSGFSSEELAGTACGVLVGSEGSSGAAAEFYVDTAEINGFETKNHGSMMSNYISFFYDLKGPSMTVNSACSSSFQALRLAYRYMEDNQCDSMIVAGSHAQFSPMANLTLTRAMMLANDGKCKVFDESADGYVRSDGIVAILLQKKSVARRVYATMKGVFDNCDGRKSQGTSFPSAPSQKDLLRDFYKTTGLNKNDVVYIETHGTGTQVGDKAEITALSEFFCGEGRKDLLIGSIKSNLGHTEVTSGLASMCKVILSFQNKMIPANIHLNQFNSNIPELFDGSVKVVRENTEWEGGPTAINSFGFGGAKVHCVMEPYREKKNENIKHTGLRLATMCGRTEEATKSFLEDMIKHKDNLEFHYLTRALSFSSDMAYPYRGYAVMNSEEEIITIEDIPNKGSDKEVWFVYNGMGSQWVGMGKDLLPMKEFRESFDVCCKAIKTVGLDLKKILVEYSEDDLQDITKTLLCVTAIQICITDILEKVGVVPNGIVGHSHGEVCCGYADKALNAEQTMLIAYHKAKSIVDFCTTPGSMAAVIGISLQELEELIPEDKDVCVACHNSETVHTISGEQNAMAEFMKVLEEKNIKCKPVKSCGIGFHSPILKSTYPYYGEQLDKIIPEPQERSSKWISSSVPEEDWEEDIGLVAGTDYYLANMSNPVYFVEACSLIPENSVVIEIGATNLLQSIVKSVVGKKATFCPMMPRGPCDEVALLANMGKIYCAGINVDPLKLAPKVEFPVKLETPMISPLFKWDHDEIQENPISSLDEVQRVKSHERLMTIKNLYVPKDSWLRSHQIDGRLVVPATYYIDLLIDVYCDFNNFDKSSPALSFTMNEWLIHKACFIPNEDYVPIRFQVTICKRSGYFEIFESNTAVVTGYFSHTYSRKNHFRNVVYHKVIVPYRKQKNKLEGYSENDPELYKKAEIYQFLARAGYEYGEALQLINNGKKNHCYITWNGNIGAFLDGINQYQAFANDIDTIYIPYVYGKVEIDLYELLHVRKIGDQVYSEIADELDYLLSGSVKMIGKRSEHINRKTLEQSASLNAQVFTPYASFVEDKKIVDYQQFTQACLKLFATSENKKDALPLIIKRIKECTEAAPALDFSLLHALRDMCDTEKTQLDRNKMSAIKEDFFLSTSISQDDILEFYSVMDQNNFNPIKSILHFGNNSLWSNILALNMGELTQFQLSGILTTEEKNDNLKKLLQFIKIARDDLSQRGNFFTYVSGLFSTHENADEELRFIFNLLKDRGGFLCIHDFTCEEDKVIDVLNFFKNHEHVHKKVSREEMCKRLQDVGFDVFFEKHNELTSVFICRPHIEVDENPTVIDVTDCDKFEWLGLLQESLKKIEKPEDRIWLITPNAEPTGVIGLIKCLKNEENGNKVRCLVNGDLTRQSLPPEYLPGGSTFKKLVKRDLLLNIYRNQTVGCTTHKDFMKARPTPEMTKNICLGQKTVGNMSSFFWWNLPDFLVDEKMAGEHGMIPVNVYYSPLNFRDVVVATGRLREQKARGNVKALENKIGSEFSGVTDSGKRVMGIGAKMTAIASKVIAPESMTWEVPENMSLGEAASIPMVYFTAYYALIVKARIKKTDKILIHSATSGVGMAALNICKQFGVKTIICTCGTPEKVRYLQENFKIPKKYIFNSRTNDFYEKVLGLTRGAGVDVILNSLSDEKLTLSFQLLTNGGRFLEIGKNDIVKNTKLGMSTFLNGVSFHAIVLETILGDKNNVDFIETRTLLDEGLRGGYVKPLPLHTFVMAEAEEAFRFMSSGTHIGKILIQIKKDEDRTQYTTPFAELKTAEKMFCMPDLVYIITGGLGGLGNELAKALLNRYAYRLVLTTRQPKVTGYKKKLFNLLYVIEENANLTVMNYDVSKYDEAVKMFDEVDKLGKIGGIFHLAGLLRDAEFANQTQESFKEVCDVKIKGTRNLDKITRERYGKDLKTFVVFSSLASGFGNAGQTPYGFGNAYADSVCEQRQADGLPGMSIQWGPMAEVGMYEETLQKRRKQLSEKGVSGAEIEELMNTGVFQAQRMDSYLDTFEKFSITPMPIVTSYVLSSPLLLLTQGKNDFEVGLQAIEKVLGVKSLAAMKSEMKLSQMGLDSIMASEIHIILRTKMGMELSPADVRNLSLGDILACGNKEEEEDD